MKKLLLIFTVILCVSTHNVKAWFDEGHMIIASIAWDELNDDEKQKANFLIKILSDADPDYSDFIRAATWMDGLKGKRLHFFDGYHFKNQYYVVYSPDVMPLYEDDNVAWAITQSLTTFNEDKPSEFSMAMSFRFLIHTVGDIHQPLHNTSRVTKETPGGDRGGNSYPIDSILYGTYKGKPSYLTELHQLWDSGVLAFNPINAADSDFDKEKGEIEMDKTKILDYIKKLNKTDFENIEKRIKTITDPVEWSKESYQFGIEYSYQGISKKPSDYYIQKGQNVCMQQVYIAGNRLAILLKEVLKKVKLPS